MLLRNAPATVTSWPTHLDLAWATPAVSCDGSTVPLAGGPGAPGSSFSSSTGLPARARTLQRRGFQVRSRARSQRNRLWARRFRVRLRVL